MLEPLRFMASGSNPHIILVALDDNDVAWYEMFIPFVVSLASTTWRGRLGVIDYGLSLEKKNIITSGGVLIYPCEGVTTLPSDRFLAAARILDEDPTLTALALYDADVWFPATHFDLFDQLTNDVEIHVAPDVQACNFIFEPVIGESATAIKKTLTDAISSIGCALQAGLILGGRVAWRDFGRHVRSCLERVGNDFSVVYGLDTTLLHLWAAKSKINLLSPVYNLVPKFGVDDVHDIQNGHIVLKHKDVPVQALHMVSDSRYLNRLRFLTRHYNQMLSSASSLSLPSKTSPSHLVSLSADTFTAFAALSLDVECIECSNTDFLYIGPSLVPGKGISILSWHGLSVTLTARHSMYLKLWATFFDNQPSALRMEVLLNDRLVASFAPTFNLDGPINCGDVLTLRSLALPGQGFQSTWHIATDVFK